jgi:hypothetical protein
MDTYSTHSLPVRNKPRTHHGGKTEGDGEKWRERESEESFADNTQANNMYTQQRNATSARHKRVGWRVEESKGGH